MPKINLLSPFVADLIAAGEVVERAGSVIKELLENAIDADAGSITVTLKNGGMTFIRVTDDGCGMSPEDAGVAFLRHATSKISNERGLEAIGTLGFRGEALAAISAVSRIELTTRERGAVSGTLLTLEAGEIQKMHETGCPEGTTITVRDLFFNTPARLKFIRSDRAEGAYCQSLALRCALAHPEVSIRLIRDDREEFFTPGDGAPRSAMYSLLGRDISATMLDAKFDNEQGITVTGFVSSPRAGRGNRAAQYFFVNGRSIRSQALQAALENAYKNTLLTGRFPSCVLYITLAPSSVDVNVHPTKAEVKFSDERAVFDGVYFAARNALEGESVISKPQAPKAEPKPDFFINMDAGQFRQASAKWEKAPAQASFHSPIAQYRKAPPQLIEATPAKQAQKPSPAPDDAVRIVGEAMETYIVAEYGAELVFIDKHAAHERIIFDRLASEKHTIMRQSLLAPQTFTPGAHDTELLIGALPLLAEFGFELEPFGEDSIIIRSVPADIDAHDCVPMLEQFLEKLRNGQRLSPDASRDELLHSVACKAAIKAGRRSEPGELLALAQRVVSGEIKYCPHGRPVLWTVTKSDLDKNFKRI